MELQAKQAGLGSTAERDTKMEKLKWMWQNRRKIDNKSGKFLSVAEQLNAEIGPRGLLSTPAKAARSAMVYPLLRFLPPPEKAMIPGPVPPLVDERTARVKAALAAGGEPIPSNVTRTSGSGQHLSRRHRAAAGGAVGGGKEVESIHVFGLPLVCEADKIRHIAAEQRLALEAKRTASRRLQTGSRADRVRQARKSVVARNNDVFLSHLQKYANPSGTSSAVCTVPPEPLPPAAEPEVVDPAEVSRESGVRVRYVEAVAASETADNEVVIFRTASRSTAVRPVGAEGTSDASGSPSAAQTGDLADEPDGVSPEMQLRRWAEL